MDRTPGLPPFGLSPGQAPLIRQPTESQRISVLGVTVDILVSSGDTDGVWALLDCTVPSQFRGPALHWHKHLTETFYLVSGKLGFRVQDQEQELNAGAVVVVPPRVVHSFSNPGDEPARFLTLLSPGGFEGYWLEVAQLLANEPAWPPADMSRIDALRAKYDTFDPPVVLAST